MRLLVNDAVFHPFRHYNVFRMYVCRSLPHLLRPHKADKGERGKNNKHGDSDAQALAPARLTRDKMFGRTRRNQYTEPSLLEPTRCFILQAPCLAASVSTLGHFFNARTAALSHPL